MCGVSRAGDELELDIFNRDRLDYDRSTLSLTSIKENEFEGSVPNVTRRQPIGFLSRGVLGLYPANQTHMLLAGAIEQADILPNWRIDWNVQDGLPLWSGSKIEVPGFAEVETLRNAQICCALENPASNLYAVTSGGRGDKRSKIAQEKRMMTGLTRGKERKEYQLLRR